MKITLCASIAFTEKMLSLTNELTALGHEVQMPPTHITAQDGSQMPVLDYYKQRKEAEPDDAWVWQTKAKAMRNHFIKIEWADVILVVNEDKNGIAGYIGVNTLMEMGLAFHLNKPIYLLQTIPQQDSTEEILGMEVIELHGDLQQLAA